MDNKPADPSRLSVTAPVFLWEPNDLVVFTTVEGAESYAESWYDEYGIELYDILGLRLTVLEPSRRYAGGVRLAVNEDFPPNVERLREILRAYFEATGKIWLQEYDEIDVPTLVARLCAIRAVEVND